MVRSLSCPHDQVPWYKICPVHRITVPEIMEHPWYKISMRKHFEDALTRLKVEQDEVEEKVRGLILFKKIMKWSRTRWRRACEAKGRPTSSV